MSVRWSASGTAGTLSPDDVLLVVFRTYQLCNAPRYSMQRSGADNFHLYFFTSRNKSVLGRGCLSVRIATLMPCCRKPTTTS